MLMKIMGARRDPKTLLEVVGGATQPFPGAHPARAPGPGLEGRPRSPHGQQPPGERGWRQMRGQMRRHHSRSSGSRARRAWGWRLAGPGCRVPAHLPQRQEGLPEIHGPGEEQHGAEDALLGRQLPQRLQRRPRPHGHRCGPVLGVHARSRVPRGVSQRSPSLPSSPAPRSRPHATRSSTHGAPPTDGNLPGPAPPRAAAGRPEEALAPPTHFRPPGAQRSGNRLSASGPLPLSVRQETRARESSSGFRSRPPTSGRPHNNREPGNLVQTFGSC